MNDLIEPIRARLRRENRVVAEIRYGEYGRRNFAAILAQARSIVFLCESETQGMASSRGSRAAFRSSPGTAGE